MPLRWDPLLVRELARELTLRLEGARVRALRMDGASRRLALLLREQTLAWGLHPSDGVLRLLPPTDPWAGDLTLKGRIRRVRAVSDERVLVVEILPLRGGPGHDLVVELLGNQWNALVVERPSGTVRHVLVRRDGPRPARVGVTYQPPTPQLREGTTTPLDATRWSEILDAVPPPQRPRVLVSRIAWTSPLNAQALLADDGQGYRLWRDITFGDGPTRPALLSLGGTVQPYPWSIPGTPGEPFPTLLDAFAALGLPDRRGADSLPTSTPGPPGLLPSGLMARLERALDAQRRQATSILAQWDALEDPERMRGLGDLLLARYAQVPPGTGEVVLEGFDGNPVPVRLDPTQSVDANARAYYARAAKSTRARERLPGLLERARARVSTLEGLLARTLSGEATAEEVAASLPEGGLPPHRAGERSSAPPSLPYRSFLSSGGLEIRVGRGAHANDDLTFRHASPGDVWLHARHTAGAHVILRWGKAENPPARDLMEAATLAALHSQARTSGSVPVDWTFRKYVRKPRGAPRGSVVPDRVRTLMVRPDESLLERLAVE